MARYKTRSKHVNRSRSRTRKQRGGFFDFLTNLFKPKENTGVTAPIAANTADDNNNPPPAPQEPQQPQQPPAQVGGSRKKSKKHHHRRHRK
jgi:hypothetical protein